MLETITISELCEWATVLEVRCRPHCIQHDGDDAAGTLVHARKWLSCEKSAHNDRPTLTFSPFSLLRTRLHRAKRGLAEPQVVKMIVK